jgi:hypothetical protein
VDDDEEEDEDEKEEEEDSSLLLLGNCDISLSRELVWGYVLDFFRGDEICKYLDIALVVWGFLVSAE